MKDRMGILAVDSFEDVKAEPARMTWLPIETCPRDGTTVLLIGHVYHGVPFAGYWGPSEHNPNRPWISVVNEHYIYEHTPTHWMAIPPR